MLARLEGVPKLRPQPPIRRPASRSTSGRFRPVVVAVALAALVGLVGACDSDSGGEAGDAADAGGVGSAGSVGLSDDGRRGLEVAEDNGCESCHQVGGGGIGPDWEGRYGSTVTLDDDSTVTVDDEYLITAIVDPSAQIADGYDVRMPSRNLSDADVASIVAYIRELNPGAADTADTNDNAVP